MPLARMTLSSSQRCALKRRTCGSPRLSRTGLGGRSMGVSWRVMVDGAKYFGAANENSGTDMNRPEAARFAAIGQPLRRKEDLRLITGAGRFSDDFSLDGQVYAAMVRSPHPHARIRAIDTSRARELPGVLGVFTGADVHADGLKPIPHDPLPKTRTDLKLTGPGGGSVFIGPHALLPADKTRHVGEAVAMVVAATRAQALDRKSTRLNSSHVSISYAVFCLQKKITPHNNPVANDRDAPASHPLSTERPRRNSLYPLLGP